MTSQNVPELRLEGFEGEWSDTPFGHLAGLERGLTYSPSDITTRGTGVRVLRSSNIDDDRFVIRNDDVFVNPSAVTISTARAGEILITASNGSSRLVGKRALIQETENPSVAGGFMLTAKPKICAEFLHASMGSRWYRTFLDTNVAGGAGAIGNLNGDALSRESVPTPLTAEQQAIGEIFTNLDTTIVSHKKKLDLLKQTKTSLLQRMFPADGATVPELRLDGFEGEWAMVKLGSIAHMYQPHTISGEELQPSGIPVFGANGFIGFYHSANHQNDQVTISARGEKTGTPSYVPGPAWITGNSMVVNVDYADIDKRFLYADLGAMSLKKFVTGGAQPQLTREVLNEVEVPTPPTVEEQQAIGAVFAKLDTLISAEAQYIDKLTQTKTALLQKMFV